MEAVVACVEVIYWDFLEGLRKEMINPRVPAYSEYKGAALHLLCRSQVVGGPCVQAPQS
jgi:hypothetical protein